MEYKKKYIRGFTLVEVLVVVLVVGILGGIVLSVINRSGIKSKTRDSRRAADLKKVQHGLEFYFANNRKYPTSPNWGDINTVLSPVLIPDCISQLPADPSDHTYIYKTNDSGSTYILAAEMENASSNSESPCTSLDNWDSLKDGIPIDATVCYGVKDPLGGATSGGGTFALVVTFSGDTQLGHPAVLTPFEVPAGYENTATVSGVVWEGHAHDSGCNEGPNNDGGTWPCDMGQPNEEIEIRINGNHCFTHTDRNPDDDRGFSFSVSCAVTQGSNTLEVQHTGRTGGAGSVSYEGTVKVSPSN